jgi:hypothetical protein
MDEKTMIAALAAGLGRSPCLAHADLAPTHDGNQPLRADGHAPRGVMGDHTDAAGDVRLSYHDKSMRHLTFQGGAGTTVLGGFDTGSEGFGDVEVSALVGPWERGDHSQHASIRVSLPTGSTSETGRIGYGAQLAGVVRTGSNDGYTLGDEWRATLWSRVRPAPWISLPVRVEAGTVDRIDGIGSRIMRPVQTADPDNYGGEPATLHSGGNLIGRSSALRGHRLASEAEVPLPETSTVRRWRPAGP